MGKLPLEKVIEMLEKLDVHEWKSSLYLDGDGDYYFKKGYPVLSVNLHGLSFHLVKFEKYTLGRIHYFLEISNLEKDLRLFSYNKGRKVLKNFYEKTFEKLKGIRQEEFEENLERLQEKLKEMPE